MCTNSELQVQALENEKQVQAQEIKKKNVLTYQLVHICASCPN
jgi:hypothetical protein